jgi:hypothetical protein
VSIEGSITAIIPSTKSSAIDRPRYNGLLHRCQKNRTRSVVMTTVHFRSAQLIHCACLRDFPNRCRAEIVQVYTFAPLSSLVRSAIGEARHPHGQLSRPCVHRGHVLPPVLPRVTGRRSNSYSAPSVGQLCDAECECPGIIADGGDTLSR